MTTMPCRPIPIAASAILSLGAVCPGPPRTWRGTIRNAVAAPATAERLDSLRLRCGEYRAYWDGKYLDGQREATPGVYYYQLTVDGERYTRKMIAQKRVTSQQ